MAESTWEAEENRGTKQGSTSESELLEISLRKDLLRWTPIFEVSIRDALLYQFCIFIFNMGLTPPPFLNNVKKKRLVQRGLPNKHPKQNRISLVIWQCFSHQRILTLHCNSVPKRGDDKSLLFFTFWIVGYSYGKWKWKSVVACLKKIDLSLNVRHTCSFGQIFSR